MSSQANLPSRQDVEEFLFEEAALLDAWDLDAWAALFTDDASYTIPATNLRESEPNTSYTIVNDDIVRIRGRVERLKSRHAHREFPWSRTRRFISNVRLLDVNDGEVNVSANFLVVRCRNEHVDQLSGRYLYTLVGRPPEFQIRRRHAELDMETIGTRGAISMIL